ncbi:tripartite motif-containing protein 3-like [Lytechinus variegatus]|uniref:tripartite motif-containing protein 3-like n=1 Tax=Lytechinus variegatus TaxID=7654 RepID=UPI001BB25BEE|nr:tripartite motif-containing protein 3-like [Lytechinus variegatus]
MYTEDGSARMRDLLSEGALSAIVRGDKVDQPLVQLLEYRKLPSRRGSSQRSNYRLVISDGTNTVTAMLASVFNRMIETSKLDLKAVFQINHYSCNFIANRAVIVILDLEVIKRGLEVKVTIGQPTPLPIQTESTSSNDATNEPTEQPKAQLSDGCPIVESPLGLTCPLCLHAFKDPAFLQCGHTFCRSCLEKHDEQHPTPSYLECPVCSSRTQLGPDRVAGLAANLTVKYLADDAQVKIGDGPSLFCSLHSDVYKDILCVVCNDVICINCFIDKHQGHRIKKVEVIEAEVKKDRDTLLEKSKEMRDRIEKYIATTNTHKLAIESHFDGLRKKVQNIFEKKMEVLKQEKDMLLGKLTDIQNGYVDSVERFMVEPRTSLETINKHIATLAEGAHKPLDVETIKAGELLCIDLRRFLITPLAGIGDEGIQDVKKVAVRTRYHPPSKTSLDLGSIGIVRSLYLAGRVLEQPASALRRSTASRVGSGRNWNTGGRLTNRRSVRGIPKGIHKSIKDIARVELPLCKRTRITASYQDILLATYGAGRPGAERFCILMVILLLKFWRRQNHDGSR